MGTINVVLHCLCRVSLEICATRKQDAFPDDVVVFCFPEYGVGDFYHRPRQGLPEQRTADLRMCHGRLSTSCVDHCVRDDDSVFIPSGASMAERYPVTTGR